MINGSPCAPVIRLMRVGEVRDYWGEPGIAGIDRRSAPGAVIRMLGGQLRTVRQALAAVGFGAAVLVLVAACGSSSSSGSTSASSSASASSSTSPSASASPSSSTSASQPADPAAAKTQITKNWETFFDPKTSTSQRVALLQNGQVLRPAITALSGTSQGRAVSSKVTSVTFTSATAAAVGYQILLSGRVVLPNGTGESVLDNGTWKVGTKSLCGLLALVHSGKAIPGC